MIPVGPDLGFLVWLLKAVLGPHDADAEQRQQVIGNLNLLRPALALAVSNEGRPVSVESRAQFVNATSDLRCQARVLSAVLGGARKDLEALVESASDMAHQLVDGRVDTREARRMLDAVDRIAVQLRNPY